MPIPVNAVTRGQRYYLLAKIEAFAVEFLADLQQRNADRRSFWCYMNFCTPMVMDLIAWEKIHAVDLKKMPAVKQLFFEAARAARISYRNNGKYDPEFDRGRGRRTFNEIGEAELAANILPRLEQILYSWGITYDECENSFTERALTENEIDRLTRYYGEV